MKGAQSSCGECLRMNSEGDPTKEHLWEFMEAEGIFTEPFDMLGGMDLLHSLDRFFDRILYFAAVGYQNAQQLEQARHGHAAAHM